jgi:hypothetical protein
MSEKKIKHHNITTEKSLLYSFHVNLNDKRADGCFFIIAYKAAIAFYISNEDGCELTLKTFICHMAPATKVSN